MHSIYVHDLVVQFVLPPAELMYLRMKLCCHYTSKAAQCGTVAQMLSLCIQQLVAVVAFVWYPTTDNCSTGNWQLVSSANALSRLWENIHAP